VPEQRSGDPTDALDRIADGLLSVDEDWRVTYADDRATDLLAIDGGDPFGRNLWSAVEGDPALLEAECRRARTASESTVLEARLPGAKEPLSVEVYPSETGVTMALREDGEPEESLSLDRLLEATPVAVLVLDDGEAVRTSDRAADLFGAGFRIGDVELYDEGGDRVPVAERPYVRALEHGEAVRGRRYRIDSGGASHRVELSAVPLHADAEAEGRRVLVTAVEVPEGRPRREGAAAIRGEPDTELSRVFERVASAFFAVDDEWRFTFLNESAEELVDVDADAVRGTSIWEVFPEAAGTAFEREYRRAMEEQEPVSFESYYPPLDAWFEVDAYPSESGLSVYFRDVSERKARERELERQRDALERHREELERLVDISALAREVTRWALRTQSRTEVESLVCETLAESSYYETAWIGGASAEDGADAGGVEFRAGAGLDERSLRTLAGTTFDAEPSTVATALRRDSVQVRQNRAEVDDPRREVFAERDIRSSIALPLTHEDREFGVLTVDTTRKHAFAGVERDVLEGMAETVSRALDAAEHRQRYRSLVEDALDTGADVGISVLDEDGRVVWFTEALETYFGVDREEVLGREAPTAVHEVLRTELEDPPRIVEVEEPAGEGVPSGGRTELRVETGDAGREEDGAYGGTERFLERRSIDVETGLYAGGRVEIYTDVTERTRSKRALAERERMWSTLIGNLPGAVYRCRNEPGWPMAFVSERVEALTGYAAARFESGEVSWEEDVVHPEDRGPLAEEVESSLAAGESFRTTYRIRTADGETRWVWEQGSPAGEGAGDVEFLEGFISDVTEREWASREQELVEELTREATTADSLDEALLAVVERVRVETGWNHGEVWTPEGDGRLVLAARTGEGTPREVCNVPGERTFEPGEGLVGRTYASGEPVYRSLDGDDERPVTQSGTAGSTDLETAVAVPVTGEGGTMAVLAFYLEDDLPVPDPVVRAVETVGDRIGEVLAYRRSEMARRRSERERERLVHINRLIRRITGALVAADSHEDIEETVCRRLVEHDPYVFAWYGEPVFGEGSAVEPRQWAGREEGYLDEVTVTFDESATGGGPAGRAVRSDSVVDCADVETDEAYEPWREAALERGYRSTLAVPVSYGETQHGLLCVYAEEPDAFSGEVRSVFAELGDAIAHAKSAIYRKEGLFSESMVQLEFRFPSPIPEGLGLSESSSSGDPELTVEETTSRSDGELVHYVRTTALSAESLETFVEESPSLTDYRRLGGTDSDRYVLRQDESRLIDLLSTYGGRVRSLGLDDDRTHLVLELPQGVDVREFVCRIEEQYPDASLEAQRTVSHEEVTPEGLADVALCVLTEKQREAIQVAYHSGYFSWPRETDGETVAEVLGISPSTFHQHLRAAERKLTGVVFGDRGTD
jgi:PAS domain S-box-containing protein